MSENSTNCIFYPAPLFHFLAPSNSVLALGKRRLSERERLPSYFRISPKLFPLPSSRILEGLCPIEFFKLSPSFPLEPFPLCLTARETSVIKTRKAPSQDISLKSSRPITTRRSRATISARNPASSSRPASTSFPTRRRSPWPWPRTRSS